MENFKFGRDQLPQELEPAKAESFESLNERIEVLEGITKEFEKEVAPALHQFEMTSPHNYTDGNVYSDMIHRKAFAELLKKLSAFEVNVKSIFELFEQTGGGAGLNNLYASIIKMQERLIAAPDVRYNREAQIESYGGKENVPAGGSLDTFEETQKTALGLKGEMRGIEMALTFLSPEKVRN
ncbi:MAG: hypothetical protein WC087_00925 [Candidatus Paceibacterota bacterium]